MQLLCSLRVCVLSCPIEAGMGKPFVGFLRELHHCQRLSDPALTGQTSQRAGGQDSLLSDACFLLALIDRRQSPPAESHILTKRISEKSAGADCSADLTGSPRAQHSQMTSEENHLNRGVQAAQLRTQTCIISCRNEKATVSLNLHACHEAGSGLSAFKLLFVWF